MKIIRAAREAIYVTVTDDSKDKGESVVKAIGLAEEERRRRLELLQIEESKLKEERSINIKAAMEAMEEEQRRRITEEVQTALTEENRRKSSRMSAAELTEIERVSRLDMSEDDIVLTKKRASILASAVAASPRGRLMSGGGDDIVVEGDLKVEEVETAGQVLVDTNTSLPESNSSTSATTSSGEIVEEAKDGDAKELVL
jgi:hypothetical protein